MTKRVLIVDDEAMISSMMADCLEEEGWGVEVAEDLAAARRSLSASVLPDVLIIDRTLPDGNGFEFAADLKLDPRFQNVPLVLISAHDKSRAESAALPGVPLLTKPFALQDLRNLIGQALSKTPPLHSP